MYELCGSIYYRRMIDLDTIGYYLYMEEQENRSRELKQAQKVNRPRKRNKGRTFLLFREYPAPLWTEIDKSH